MANRAQAIRKRIASLAYECGFGAFAAPYAKGSKLYIEGKLLGLVEMLHDVPDEDLREFEAALNDLQRLQEAIRSLN